MPLRRLPMLLFGLLLWPVPSQAGAGAGTEITSGISVGSRLDLSGGNLSVLTSQVLLGFGDIVEIDLESNRIESVEVGAFEGVPRLERLCVCNNRIHVVEKGSFDGVPSLTDLGLCHNQIWMVESDSLSGLTSLTYLSLNGNRFQMVQKHMRLGLSSLTHLRLDDNLIEWIDEDAFIPVPMLEMLFVSTVRTFGGRYSTLTGTLHRRLDNNLLQTIETGLFKGLPSLVDLYESLAAGCMHRTDPLNNSQGIGSQQYRCN